jgi:hypothetical protein
MLTIKQRRPISVEMLMSASVLAVRMAATAALRGRQTARIPGNFQVLASHLLEVYNPDHH